MSNTGGDATVGSGDGVNPLTTPDGGASSDGSAGGPASWLIPAVVGLVTALVIALGVVLLTGNEADAPLAPEPATSVEPDPTVAPDVDSTIVEPEATEPPTTDPAATEAPAPDAVPAPDVTETPAPDTTGAPAPTVDPDSSVVPATAGFVRIMDDEFPIERICASSPQAGFGLTTYVFDDNGFAEVVELGSDEGNSFGLVFGDGYDVIDFGDEGFGLEADQGDGIVAVSVNPSGAESMECPGTSTVSNTSSPEFQDVTHAVVDVCLGDVPRFDENNEVPVGFGYLGIIAEGGQFVAWPGANGGSFALDYIGPAGAFSASTDSATSIEGPDGLEITADLVGNPGGQFEGESRRVVITIDDDLVETCRPI